MSFQNRSWGGPSKYTTYVPVSQWAGVDFVTTKALCPWGKRQPTVIDCFFPAKFQPGAPLKNRNFAEKYLSQISRATDGRLLKTTKKSLYNMRASGKKRAIRKEHRQGPQEGPFDMERRCGQTRGSIVSQSSCCVDVRRDVMSQALTDSSPRHIIVPCMASGLVRKRDAAGWLIRVGNQSLTAKCGQDVGIREEGRGGGFVVDQAKREKSK